MATLQIREVPEEVYEALALRARIQRRSLAQQAVVELARMPEVLARRRRLAVIEQLRDRIQSTPPRRTRPSVVSLVRADRRR